ncbi:hypothetical protein BC828DRAFT_217321 [Blastocladiella britannica]|nr:hypothetical protein BC828DRAFT_217321 [Blastocladiella britannica]
MASLLRRGTSAPALPITDATGDDHATSSPPPPPPPTQPGTDATTTTTEANPAALVPRTRSASANAKNGTNGHGTLPTGHGNTGPGTRPMSGGGIGTAHGSTASLVLHITPPPDHFVCPLTGDLMRDPTATTTCGHLFERDAIVQWFHDATTSGSPPGCPVCGTTLGLSDSLVPCFPIRTAIADWIRARDAAAAVSASFPAAPLKDNVCAPMTFLLHVLIKGIRAAATTDTTGIAQREGKGKGQVHQSVVSLQELAPWGK